MPDPIHDPINHPKHYTSHPSGVECIQITEHLPFCLGNAIKYLWRAGLKAGTTELQDLRKAAWYIEREIQRREKKRPGPPLDSGFNPVDLGRRPRKPAE